jgi:hypothetical protein
VLDQPLHVGLELVVVLAVGAPFEVELELQDLGRVQLAIHVAIELVRAILTVHDYLFLSRLWHRLPAVAADDT